MYVGNSVTGSSIQSNTTIAAISYTTAGDYTAGTITLSLPAVAPPTTTPPTPPTAYTNQGGLPCKAIQGFDQGSNIVIRDLRFTNGDNIWFITFSSTSNGALSNVVVENCQFDNIGNPGSTGTTYSKHDHSSIYIDAIGSTVRDCTWWQGAPGASSFVTNYGARTAIELHGSNQHCYNNTTHGMQWLGNLVASTVAYEAPEYSSSTITAANYTGTTATYTVASHNFSYGQPVAIFGITETGSTGSYNTTNYVTATTSTTVTVTNTTTNTYTSGGTIASIRMCNGANWHDNQAYHAKVGIDIVPYAGSTTGTSVGLRDINIHDNVVTIDSSIWNLDTGAGTDLGGIRYLNSSTLARSCGPVENVSIQSNKIELVKANVSSLAYTGDPPAWIISDWSNSTSQIIDRDWIISDNTIIGSLASGIHIKKYAQDGLVIESNLIRDCGLSYSGPKYGIYATTLNNQQSSNLQSNWLITTNTIEDDQVSYNVPYGYIVPPMSGPIYLGSTSGASNNVNIIDNVCITSYAKSFSPCDLSSNVWNVPPYLRGIAHSWAAPTGYFAIGSSVTLTNQRNVGTLLAVTYYQVGQYSGNAGNTWVPMPALGTGLTNASSYSRFVGATTSGAPTSGTWSVGDWIVDQSGAFWICTAAPSTWTSVGGTAGGDLTGAYPNPTIGYTSNFITQSQKAAQEWMPANQGNLKGWTGDITGSTTNQLLSTLAASGVLILQGIVISNVPAGGSLTIQNILLWLVTAGATLTSGQNFIGLYNSAGTLLGTSADQSTNWTTSAGTLKTTALMNSVTITSPGIYYVGLLWNGTTAPTFLGFPSNFTAMLNIGANATSAGTLAGGNRSMVLGSGFTTLPASVSGTPSAAGRLLGIGLT